MPALAYAELAASDLRRAPRHILEPGDGLEVLGVHASTMKAPVATGARSGAGGARVAGVVDLVSDRDPAAMRFVRNTVRGAGVLLAAELDTHPPVAGIGDVTGPVPAPVWLHARVAADPGPDRLRELRSGGAAARLGRVVGGAEPCPVRGPRARRELASPLRHASMIWQRPPAVVVPRAAVLSMQRRRRQNTRKRPRQDLSQRGLPSQLHQAAVTTSISLSHVAVLACQLSAARSSARDVW